jgi:hypothetical protein
MTRWAKRKGGMAVGSHRAAIAAMATIIVLVSARSAYALSCKSELFTLSEAYEAADSIIVALVTECQEEVSSDSWASGGDGCSFVSLEVLKDAVPVRDYGGVASSSGCGLSVNVGSQYLLFLDSENRPMHFSAPLAGDHYLAQQTGQYLRILRDFRSGYVSDLSEPWLHYEYEGYCAIRQSVAGHQISFSRRMPDAPPEPKPEWIRETVNGETVHRATVPVLDSENRLPAGDAQIVAFGDVPDYADNALGLRVSLQDTSPATVRQATLSVDDRTWLLNRMEMNLFFHAGAPGHKSVDYWAAGETAEQILAAMAQPSRVVVSATLVPSRAASEVRDVPMPNEPASEMPVSTNGYFGPAPPVSESAGLSVQPTVPAADSYRAQEEPAEPVIRLESRSTQLSREIKAFRACYAAERQ